MKRSMCGLIVLAAVTVLWSCKGDPIDPSGERILADPSSVFLDQGASEFVVVQMVDNQGNQLAADFEAQSVGPGISVVKDTTFLQTTIGTTLETRERFIVTGTAPTASSFQVVSGGQTITIPVRVTPTGATVTLSNATPAMNEPLVITLPAGYKFGSAPGATVGADQGITVAVAPDSSSVTVLFPPGTTGTITVDSVQVDFLPGVNLALPTTQTVTVGSTPLPGTESPTTAPAIPVPGVGATTVTFDVPDFAATIDHFYRLDVPEDGEYTITIDWDIGSDIDAVVCEDASCASFADPDFGAATAAHPESATFTLLAGTRYLLVEDFAPIADPPGTPAIGATVTIIITREVPAGT